MNSTRKFELRQTMTINFSPVPLVDKEMCSTALVVGRCSNGDVPFDQDIGWVHWTLALARYHSIWFRQLRKKNHLFPSGIQWQRKKMSERNSYVHVVHQSLLWESERKPCLYDHVLSWNHFEKLCLWLCVAIKESWI